MDKIYKYYVTKNEKVIFILALLLITASVIWAISQNRNYLLLVFIGPVTYLFYPFTFILTADNMLDFRNLFRRTVKPLSVNQITRVTQKSKNEAVLVYNRDGLRGDRILHLSETDMKDFLDELIKRNPAIEIKKNTLYEKKSLHS